MTEILPLAALGAVLGADVVSFPQAMVSRPLVAATLAAWITGDAERGMLIGAVLEMVALGTLPFGAARYPDWGSASVVGGALFARAGAAQPGQLTLAVLAVLLAAWLSGQSMVWHRELNGRRARHATATLAQGDLAALRRLQASGLVSDLVRGAVVTAVALALLAPAFEALAPLWVGRADIERAALAGITSALGGATIWMLVRGAVGARRLLAAGVAAGAFLILA
jgi:PTS system mannose-specific IIC component